MWKRICLLALAVTLGLGAPGAARAETPGNALGLRALRAIYAQEGQTVLSPFGLATALSMAAEGAKGQTYDELARALGLDEGTLPIGIAGVQIANAAYVSPKCTVLDGYKDALTGRYGAALFSLEGGVMEAVNQWAAENTGGMIDNLLDKEPDDLARLLLLNAVALDCEWETPFEAADTQSKPFHAPDGDVEAEYLCRTDYGMYREENGVQMMRLPYADDELSLLVLLPEAGGMEALLDALCESGAPQVGSDDLCYVRLELPKANLAARHDLSATLIELGIGEAFSQEADFSAIDGTKDLCVGQVVQSAALAIDEQGTKAAAATEVEIVVKSAFVADQPAQMLVDRPYVLLIEDGQTGTILFAACVDNP